MRLIPRAFWSERLRRLSGPGLGAQLVRGATAFLSIQVCGVALSFWNQVLLARFLGTESFGTYTIVQSWLTVLLVGCRLGLVNGALRFVPAYASLGQFALLRGFLLHSYGAVLAVSVTVGLALFVVILLSDLAPTHEFRVSLWIGSAMLAPQALLQLTSSVLRGLKHVAMSQVPTVIILPCAIAGILIGAHALGLELGADSAMVVFSMATIVALGVSAWALIPGLPREVLAARSEQERAAWRKVAIPLLLINGVNVLQQQGDVLTIGALVSAEEAGIYAAASRVSNVIPFGLLAVNAWAAPYFSEFYARSELRELQRVVRIACLTILAFTVPLATGAIVFGPIVLGVFGEGFEPGYPSLVILSVGQIVNAITGPVGLLMMMTGHQAEALRILGLHAGITILLNLGLVPWLGIEGAAIASSVTQGSRNLWMAVAVWRRLGIRATFF